MYPVSDVFLLAVKQNTRKYYWTGRITAKGGTVYDFDKNDIVKGSGYITSQCCGSTEIELGTVYAAEMGISLFCDIDRYTLEDVVITPCSLQMVRMKKSRWGYLKYPRRTGKQSALRSKRMITCAV